MSISSPAASTAGTVNLGLMGSGSTAKLRYVFPSGYEVKSGAALTIADGVNVYIANLQTIAVDAGATLTVGAAPWCWTTTTPAITGSASPAR